MNKRTGYWTRGQAAIVRKVCQIADDNIAANILTATPAGRIDLENERRFVRILLLETEHSLRRVIAAEQMAGAGFK